MSKKYLILFQQYISEQNEFFEQLKKLSANTINEKRIPQKWSIGQTLAHVRISEKQIFQAILNYLKVKKRFRKPSVLNWLRFKITIWLFKLRIPLKAPKYVADVPETIDLHMLLNKWYTTRIEWIEFISSLEAPFTDHVIFVHPIVGPMNITMITEFMLEHFRVHKHQILKKLALIRQNPQN